MATNTVFYKKVRVGKSYRYKPVYEYNPELTDSLPFGTHVQVCNELGMSRRYNIDPALAPFAAAAMILEDKLINIIRDASGYKLANKQSEPLTPEQNEAWDNLNKSFGGKLTTLYGPSLQEIASNILKAISNEAEKLLTNNTLKEHYEQFLLLSKLTKNEQTDNIR